MNKEIVFKFGVYSVKLDGVIIANYKDEYTALNHLEALK